MQACRLAAHIKLVDPLWFMNVIFHSLLQLKIHIVICLFNRKSFDHSHVNFRTKTIKKTFRGGPEIKIFPNNFHLFWLSGYHCSTITKYIIKLGYTSISHKKFILENWSNSLIKLNDLYFNMKRAFLSRQKEKGPPLHTHKMTKNDWVFLIDKVEKKLQNWQRSLLSLKGRLILLSSVLSAVSLYTLSTFKIPAHVIKKLD